MYGVNYRLDSDVNYRLFQIRKNLAEYISTTARKDVKPSHVQEHGSHTPANYGPPYAHCAAGLRLLISIDRLRP